MNVKGNEEEKKTLEDHSVEKYSCDNIDMYSHLNDEHFIITDGSGVCEKCVIGEKIAQAGIHDDFLHSVVRQLDSEVNCVKRAISILSLDVSSSLVVFRSLAKQMRQWRLLVQEGRVGIA